MEKNYGVYYYSNKDLVRSHLLRYDHLCFILEKEFRTSPRQMGCYFTFKKNDVARFCWFMTRFTSNIKKTRYKKPYLTTDFVNWITTDCQDASIDVVRFANLDDDVKMT